MRKTIVGVMGGSVADDTTLANARQLGAEIARHGWVLLSGGRPTGVMQASVSGAKEAGGLTVGVLFDDDHGQAAKGLDIVIPTGMGAARNVINILSSDVVVACRGSGGTLSEIAMALRFERPLVLLDFQPGEDFLQAAGKNPRYSHAANAAEAAEQIAGFLKERGRG
ncbi:DNA-binding protein [bacterium DOLZORAL124_64_63]|nr:MAG: DNA-binding protein [bacterium DOLZORAL124_64_63]